MLQEIKLNSKGTNAAIQAHILQPQQMRYLGFTDYDHPSWYYCQNLGHDITLNITIPKDGSDIEIITLDENFCQPYDYQRILQNDPHFPVALEIKSKVEEIISTLQSAGVLSGHNYGEYI